MTGAPIVPAEGASGGLKCGPVPGTDRLKAFCLPALLLGLLIPSGAASATGETRPRADKESSEAVSTPTAPEEAPGSLYTGWSFTVEVPPDISVCYSAPALDFALYRFQTDGDTLLTIYTGNHPDFPVAAPSSAREQAIVVAGQNARVVDWTNEDDRKSREILVDLERYFPNFLHIFYEDLSPKEVERAEAVIATLRPLE